VNTASDSPSSSKHSTRSTGEPSIMASVPPRDRLPSLCACRARTGEVEEHGLGGSRCPHRSCLAGRSPPVRSGTAGVVQTRGLDDRTQWLAGARAAVEAWRGRTRCRSPGRPGKTRNHRRELATHPVRRPVPTSALTDRHLCRWGFWGDQSPARAVDLRLGQQGARIRLAKTECGGNVPE
jgi:hypothetical protein